MFDIEVGAFDKRPCELGFFVGLPLVKNVPVGRRGVPLPYGLAVGDRRWSLLTELGEELARPVQLMQPVKGVFVKDDCLWVVSDQERFKNSLFWRITDAVIERMRKVYRDDQVNLTIAFRPQGLCGCWHAPMVAAYRRQRAL